MGRWGTASSTPTQKANSTFRISFPAFTQSRRNRTGFKTVSVPNVEVFVGKTSSLRLALEAGNISEIVEVSAGAATIDTGSTAVGQNLNDQVFQNLPVQRSVTSLFYLAPGVTDSGKGGVANPSISGGSALDNLYVADGVNITDSAFGGLGVFSRLTGRSGVGINTSFIKEVQVKTGGFEPQYGQSQGGIINIITQSGGSEYHGAVYGYAQPQAFEADALPAGRHPRTNKFGRLLHEENYDVGLRPGRSVPGLKDKLFFFGSFNPTVPARQRARRGRIAGLSGLLGDTSGATARSTTPPSSTTNLTPSHQLNFSIFGDPTSDQHCAVQHPQHRQLTAPNSELDYGTRNIAVRYNGIAEPDLDTERLVQPGASTLRRDGLRRLQPDHRPHAAGARQLLADGLGFFEPTEGTTYRATFDTTKQVHFWRRPQLQLGLPVPEGRVQRDA